MKNILKEEINKNLKLIKYDRSKILSEQDEDLITIANKWIDRTFRDDVNKSVKDINKGLDKNFRNPINDKIKAANDWINANVIPEINRSLKMWNISSGDIKWLKERFGIFFIEGELQKNPYVYHDMTLADKWLSLRWDEFNEWMRNDSLVATLTLNVAAAITRHPVLLRSAVMADLVEINAYIQPNKDNPDGDWFMGGILAIFALMNITDIMRTGNLDTSDIKQFKDYIESKGNKKISGELIEKSKKTIFKNPEILKKCYTSLWNKTIISIIKNNFPKGLKQIATLILWLISDGFFSASFLTKIAFTLTKSVAKPIFTMATVGISWYVVCRILGLPGVPKFDSLEMTQIKPESKKPKDTNQICLVNLTSNVLKILLNTNTVYSIKNKGYLPELELIDMFFDLIEPTDPDYVKTNPWYRFSLKNNKLTVNNTQNYNEIKIYNINGKILQSKVVDGQKTTIDTSKINKLYVWILSIKDNLNRVTLTKIIPNRDIEHGTFNFEGQEYNPGVYNRRFELIIQSFQKKYNLPVDGVLGPKTINKILEVLSTKKELCVEDENNIYSKIEKKYKEVSKKIEQDVLDKSEKNKELLEKNLKQISDNEEWNNRQKDSVLNSYQPIGNITEDDYKYFQNTLDSLIKNK
jgi:hypothetical protein